MSRKELLAAFAEQIGFRVEYDPVAGEVRAVGVPCLFVGGVPGTCTIATSYSPSTGKPDDRIGQAAHAVKIATDGEHDGRVYHADGTPIGNYLKGDGKTWSNISVHKGAKSNPEPDETAGDLLHRYAKQIIGAVSAGGYVDPGAFVMPDPFHMPNTFEARAAVAPIQDRIRGQSVAIIGLGGSGAHFLDIIAKTPVSEIHLFDSDCVDWHTLMRAPGVPTTEEIELIRAGSLLKVDYYRSKYATFRDGIHAHPVRVENPEMFAEFVAEHPIGFAFIFIDQLAEGDSARQDVVYRAVSGAQVPFIDSGVSITVEDSAVWGSVTTSYYEAGSDAWKAAIPNARQHGDAPGYRNVQLPEVNAAAATAALMEWRRRTGQYVSEPPSFFQKFRFDKGRISYA